MGKGKGVWVLAAAAVGIGALAFTQRPASLTPELRDRIIALDRGIWGDAFLRSVQVYVAGTRIVHKFEGRLGNPGAAVYVARVSHWNVYDRSGKALFGVNTVDDLPRYGLKDDFTTQSYDVQGRPFYSALASG